MLLEPLNRYETDLCNTLQQGSEVLHRAGGDRLALLADLFHMNIEEGRHCGRVVRGGESSSATSTS